MIHVCFAIYDKAGHYTKFTGTAILSMLENHKSPPPSITIHILHDSTLTDDNRDKLIQIVERYNQIVKFYNVEELCTEGFEKIKEFFPAIFDDRHSIAMFYRLFIPALFPQEVEKAIYLDSDIIVNLDINELWQIELVDKPFGAITEYDQLDDKDRSAGRLKYTMAICREGVVSPENYFNSGVMLMNLKVLREEEDTISAGMKFISEHPQFDFLDQDLLNYCFSTSFLRLSTKFNRMILFAKRENYWTIEEKIYHFAASRICFAMDSRDPYNQLFMKYFIQTPWIDDDNKIALSGGIPSSGKCFISMIIPLYNEEEYIGECLDSLLAQTFQAFEVIVVDDCSTDSSCDIVESYMPKFNGRLKLIHTEKNSGGGGYVARNMGLKLARGEYVYMIDADDMILTNAFESFYSAAIIYNAEVVYTRSVYILKAPDEVTVYKDEMSKKFPLLNTQLTIDDIDKNLTWLLDEYGQGEFSNIHSVFCQREFLLDNHLFFPTITRSGDTLWCVNIRFYARRFLRISTTLCIRRRYNKNSITRTVREPKEQCLFWLGGFLEFAKSLHEQKKTNKVWAENPIYDLSILSNNLVWSLNRVDYAVRKIDREELFETLYNEFSKDSSDYTASLFAFFLSFIYRENKIATVNARAVSKFAPHLTARIDIKLNNAAGDFQIVDISDYNATIDKPDWLQKDGTGYQIQSYAGKLEFAVKSNVDGWIRLQLKGMDVRNRRDKNKRIPYWIDYSNFTVNDELVFGKPKPVWHNKAYSYSLDVKADEEIKISVEWSPHRVDSLETKVLPPSSQPKIEVPIPPKFKAGEEISFNVKWHPQKADVVESPVLQPPTLPKVEKFIPSKFKPYLTARLDVKSTASDFEILSVSDDKANVVKPVWLQRNGSGYLIQSYAGNLEFVARANESGQFNLKLRGMDVLDPKDDSKRLPYWINYTKLTVNGMTIFDEPTPAWHGKPYEYTAELTAYEEIGVNVEWLPHVIDFIEQKALPLKIETVPDKFKNYLTARLDVKLTAGDLQIVDISDLNATVDKPNWLQRNGSGYVITSYEGNLEFVVRANESGQFNLKLRSMDVLDPKDSSKRLPYWINYTKLTVNGTAIFDEPTLAWHGEPYNYTTEVNANEEIKILVEWLPHMSDI